MSMPSPAAEITTCGELRSSSPPLFVNSLWTALAGGGGALLTYSELVTAKINDKKHQYAWISLLSCVSHLYSIVDHNFACVSFLHKLSGLS